MEYKLQVRLRDGQPRTFVFDTLPEQLEYAHLLYHVDADTGEVVPVAVTYLGRPRPNELLVRAVKALVHRDALFAALVRAEGAPSRHMMATSLPRGIELPRKER